MRVIGIKPFQVRDHSPTSGIYCIIALCHHQRRMLGVLVCACDVRVIECGFIPAQEEGLQVMCDEGVLCGERCKNKSKFLIEQEKERRRITPLS